MVQRRFNNRTNRLTNRTNLAIGALTLVVVVISGTVLLAGRGGESPSTAEQPKPEAPSATPPAPTPGETK